MVFESINRTWMMIMTWMIQLGINREKSENQISKFMQVQDIILIHRGTNKNKTSYHSKDKDDKTYNNKTSQMI